MGKLEDFLSGTRILKEVDSPVNGHIVVKTDLAWGTHIQAGGLTQSGGVVESVWKSTFKELKELRTEKIKDVLILGLGGGTIAKLVRGNFPDAKIVGVDLDSIMVDLGRKYLNLDNYYVDVVIRDAFEFLTNNKLPNTNHYDLVCVDLYQGDKYPEKFEKESFLKLILKKLSPEGIVIFNRLYYGEKRPMAMRFLKKLEKIFGQVEVIHPEANIMFLGRRFHGILSKISRRQKRKK
ncbi:hypothetical protein A2961_00485 [Candidatus Woesebacteria bacterium RIFCSPLOWO2_01_FULL_39_21]|uniref:PABS domain-containing protein n=1 Tax=Candidatus Woesebacteria bacterium RIFCSPLOWO2_01_FULL_39_21 TaxID=1802519 RepID=A0A1F8BAX2_9BACT|nr:MAG: hypothetical protein A2691_00405 [Candidatus Woesebacteria bacterium RIFCSPHIGHO2_01_FULL_39_23]OGM61181.1 MAG: hypothetical protein A2961_00485 [Candidatus Woesebacteria bacterium RIFCSPLOWO2_01_FULL_39_21]